MKRFEPVQNKTAVVIVCCLMIFLGMLAAWSLSSIEDRIINNEQLITIFKDEAKTRSDEKTKVLTETNRHMDEILDTVRENNDILTGKTKSK